MSVARRGSDGRAGQWLTIALGLLLGLACASTGKPRMGHVDIDAALLGSSLGQMARAEFVRKQRDAQAALAPKLERYKAMEREIESEKGGDARFDRQMELAELANEIRSELERVEGQLRIDAQRLEGPLVQRLREIIETIGREEDFALIVDADTGAALYRKPGLDESAAAAKDAGVDLTRRVTRELDAESPEPSGDGSGRRGPRPLRPFSGTVGSGEYSSARGWTWPLRA